MWDIYKFSFEEIISFVCHAGQIQLYRYYNNATIISIIVYYTADIIIKQYEYRTYILYKLYN